MLDNNVVDARRCLSSVSQVSRCASRCAVGIQEIGDGHRPAWQLFWRLYRPLWFLDGQIRCCDFLHNLARGRILLGLRCCAGAAGLQSTSPDADMNQTAILVFLDLGLRFNFVNNFGIMPALLLVRRVHWGHSKHFPVFIGVMKLQILWAPLRDFDWKCMDTPYLSFTSAWPSSPFEICWVH